MLHTIQFNAPNTFLKPKPKPPPSPSPHSHHHHPPLFLKPNPSPLILFNTKPTISSLHTQLLSVSVVLEDGPVELSPQSPSIFATDDDPTPLQVSTAVLLTGAISVFLFRSIRRRAKRAKELRMRSTGAKSMKDEALDSLKAISSVSIEPKAQPSPVQALLGGLTAGVIALILYKFTTTIEASLNRQTLSDSFSVRQITVTIRTIINGLCYLATFVFGLNSVGLFLYSGQLALNSLSEDSAGTEAKTKDEKQASSPNLSSESPKPTESSETDQKL